MAGLLEWRLSLAAAIALLPPLPANAQGATPATPVDCDPALFQSYARETHVDARRLSLLQLVTPQNFERIRAEHAALVVGGAPLGSAGSFDEFSERRRRDFAAAKFAFDADSARSWLATSSTADRLKPYIACLRARPGFTAWIDPERSNQQQATIRVMWRPVNYDGARRLRITYYGIFIDEPVQEATTLIDHEERFFTVRRSFDEPFRADLHIDRAFVIVLAIPYPPRLGR